MPLEEVLAAVPELRDAESVEPLTGGLTNTNYKVTSPSGCFVVRISGKDTSLLAIDRENEAHNTIAAAETGVGRAVRRGAPRARRARARRILEGEVMDAEKLRRGDRIAADRRRLPPPARRAPLPARLRHVRDPAPLPRDRPRARLPPARPLRGVRAADPRARARDARAPGADRAVQQRPARRELHRRRRGDAADRLRVLGQQRALVRARQRLERVEPLARAARGARRALLRAAAAQQGRARAAVGPDVEVRLDAVGVDPGRHLRPRLRLLGLGDGEVRAGRRGARRARSSSSCSPTCSATTRCRVSAVIFDFNGTLSDDEPVLCEIFMHLFAEHGKPDVGAGVLRPARRPLRPGDRAAPGSGRTTPTCEAVIAERTDPYREAVADGSTVHEHVREAVRFAAERVPLAICSGAARAEIEPVVEAAGLAACFRAIVSSDDVAHGKPDPEGYVEGARALGVDPADCPRGRGHRGRASPPPARPASAACSR